MNTAIAAAINLINEQFCHRWTRAELARTVGLSVSRFSHLFKAETGTTPILYLKSLRMQKAKGLLNTKSLSVKEVSARFNMERSHFARDFRKVTGTSPGRYKRKRRL
jgi:AraC-like DNA-binding protein